MNNVCSRQRGVLRNVPIRKTCPPRRWLHEFTCVSPSFALLHIVRGRGSGGSECGVVRCRLLGLVFVLLVSVGVDVVLVFCVVGFGRCRCCCLFLFKICSN